MPPSSQRDVKWIDGLRGIASFMVIITHLARAWDTDLFKPRDNENAAPRILQYPILRIPAQGRIGVTIFAFLTGYVCALKPIRQIRTGNPVAALSTVAKSAFRRVPRLMLPTIIATTIAWFLCQMGAFNVARRSDSWWIANASPVISPTWSAAFDALVENLVDTWVTGHCSYDDHQWTLLPLLKGSMLIYIAIFATAYMHGRYRMLVAAALYGYAYICKDATFATQFYFGMFMCELSQQERINKWMEEHPSFGYTVPPLFMVFGAYIASYPGGEFELASWSRDLERIGHVLFPKDADFPRFWSALGLQFFALGVQYHQPTKNFLSNKYLLFLGKNSFAVYLLHGTLLRTLLTMFLYGFFPPPYEPAYNEQNELIRPPEMHKIPRWTQLFTVPCWFVIVYVVAHFWTVYVDAWCGRVTKKLEDWAFAETEKSAAPLLG